MTDKHNWVKGEVITSDLLNSMTTYAEEKINALPVIGENLLLNSATMQGTGWLIATLPAANLEDNGDGTLSYIDTGQWHSTRYNFSDLIARNVVAIGDVLTYSEDVFIGDGFTQAGSLFVFGAYIGNISGATIVASNTSIINVRDMKKGWQRISVTFAVTSPPTSDNYSNALRFEFSSIPATAQFKFRKPKLERGAVATPWCPAYADSKTYTDSALSTAKSYSDGLVKNINVAAGLTTAPAFVNLQTQVNNSAVGTNLLKGTSGTLQTITNASGWTTNMPVYLSTVTTVDNDTYYTARMWISPASYDTQIQIVWKDASGKMHYDNGNLISAGKSGYSTQTSVITAGSTIQYVLIVFTAQQSTASSVSYKEAKLEKGATATPWCPAYQDSTTYTDSALATAKSYTDTTASTTLSNAKSYTDTQMSNVYTKPQVDEAITTAKSYTETTASTTLSNAKSYTDTKMSNVYTKPQVDEAITTAKSYTDTTASTTLSNAKSYTDTQLADTVKKAGLTTEPAFQALQTQVNNSVVGTNLLLNTSDYSNNWTWDVAPSIDTSQKPAILHYPSTTITSGMSAIAQQNIGSILQPSTTYTFSFYAKGSGNFRFYCYPSVAATVSSVNGVVAVSTGSDCSTIIPLTPSYNLYTITFTTLSNISGSKTLLLRQDYDPNSPTCEAYVYGMKLEKGSVATGWSVNPAEILTQTAFQALQTQVNNSAVGTNLLTGTSGTLQTVTNATGWGSDFSNINTNRTDLTNDTYTACAYISPVSHNAAIYIRTTATSNGSATFIHGNAISAGSSGYSTCTYTVPSGFYIDRVFISFTSSYTDSTQVSWKEMKLEKGATATPWCPAYQDSTTYTDSALATAKSYTDTTASTTLSNAKSYTDTKMSNVYTKPQVDGAITTAKSYTDTTASTTLSNAKSYTDTQLADTVKKAGLTTEPAFQALQSQVNNSSVGTNLLMGTATPASIMGNNSGNQLSQNTYYLVGGINVYDLYKKYGSTFTLSYDWSVTDTANAYAGVMTQQFNQVPWKASDTVNISSSNTSGHIVTTITLVNNSAYMANGFQFRLDNVPTTSTITVSNMKFEKGSVATDWCPNPSEILTQADYAKIKAAIVALGGSLS